MWYNKTKEDLLSMTFIEDETGTRFLDDDIAGPLCAGTLTRKSFLEILGAWKVLPDRVALANIISDEEFKKLADLAKASCDNVASQSPATGTTNPTCDTSRGFMMLNGQCVATG